MQRHAEALHSNNKVHACPFCRYTCNNKYNLRKHCKAQHDKCYPPLSRAEWRAKLPIKVEGEDTLLDVGQPVGMTTVVDESGVTLHIKEGEFVVNNDGQLIQANPMVEAAQAPQEVIYIKPDIHQPSGMESQTETSTLDLEGAEVIKQEHIPVSDSVWESLQNVMGEGADMSGVNLEELLKGNNVLIQVTEQDDIAKEEIGEEVTYLVIEPQTDGCVEEATVVTS